MLLAQLPGTARPADAGQVRAGGRRPPSTPDLNQASSFSTLPSWHRPDRPTSHDRFRQIFLDHWHRWCDRRLEEEVPPDQRAYVCENMQRLLLCRNPDALVSPLYPPFHLGYPREELPLC